MPSIYKVEFYRTLVSGALLGLIRIVYFRRVEARIKGPGRIRPVQIDDRAEVVCENNVDVETACYPIQSLLVFCLGLYLYFAWIPTIVQSETIPLPLLQWLSSLRLGGRGLGS